MQFWSQTDATATIVDWLAHDNDVIPKGQDLRQYYHTCYANSKHNRRNGGMDLSKSN